MNISTLRHRLDKLETKSGSAVRAPVSHPLAKLLEVLVAYYLGNAGPNDSIADAVARGLGYGKGHDLMDALRSDKGTPRSENLNARWRDAMSRLFALKGTAPDCDTPTFAATVEVLFREMPERLQQHPWLAEGGFVEAA